MGGILGNQIPLFLQHKLTLTASSVDKLTQIDKAAAEMGVIATVHLKIDTGMERIGVHYYSADTLLEAALTCQHCHVEGIYTHFANSDAADLSSARLQLERFKQVLSFYEKRGWNGRLCATLPTPAPFCSCPKPISTWCGRALSSMAFIPRRKCAKRLRCGRH
ncbi:MAG: alanine racemase [Chloroflexi bacterium]|nr:alanine racemase [Chloroflexota bacterium]